MEGHASFEVPLPVNISCLKMDLLALPFILIKDLSKGIKAAIAFQRTPSRFPQKMVLV